MSQKRESAQRHILDMIHLTPETYERTTTSGKVIVVWGAEWHTGSKAVARRLQRMSEAAVGFPQVYCIDVNVEPGLANTNKILELPTCVLYRYGQLVTQQSVCDDHFIQLCLQ